MKYLHFRAHSHAVNGPEIFKVTEYFVLETCITPKIELGTAENQRFQLNIVEIQIVQGPGSVQTAEIRQNGDDEPVHRGKMGLLGFTPVHGTFPEKPFNDVKAGGPTRPQLTKEADLVYVLNNFRNLSGNGPGISQKKQNH